MNKSFILYSTQIGCFGRRSLQLGQGSTGYLSATFITSDANTVRLREETAIYRVFAIYNFHQKNLFEPY
ncbi:hypothetical protein H6G91_09005 [Nostoc muscorum FACHB-395]|nr:hypothetical protein [Desmonostoc muscorum FACHB-395]